MAKTGKNITDRLGNSPQAARVSGQKGRPQARPTTRPESKAPATRPQARPATTASGKASKTPASPASTRVSGAKAQATAPGRPRARSTTGQEPFQSTRDAMASRRMPVGGTPSRPSVRPQARPQRSVSYATWKNMSRAERRAANLPVSDMPEAAYNTMISRN